MNWFDSIPSARAALANEYLTNCLCISASNSPAHILHRVASLIDGTSTSDPLLEDPVICVIFIGMLSWLLRPADAAPPPDSFSPPLLSSLVVTLPQLRLALGAQLSSLLGINPLCDTAAVSAQFVSEAVLGRHADMLVMIESVGLGAVESFLDVRNAAVMDDEFFSVLDGTVVMSILARALVLPLSSSTASPPCVCVAAAQDTGPLFRYLDAVVSAHVSLAGSRPAGLSPALPPHLPFLLSTTLSVLSTMCPHSLPSSVSPLLSPSTAISWCALDGDLWAQHIAGWVTHYRLNCFLSPFRILADASVLPLHTSADARDFAVTAAWYTSSPWLHSAASMELARHFVLDSNPFAGALLSCLPAVLATAAASSPPSSLSRTQFSPELFHPGGYLLSSLLTLFSNPVQLPALVAAVRQALASSCSPSCVDDGHDCISFRWGEGPPLDHPKFPPFILIWTLLYQHASEWLPQATVLSVSTAPESQLAFQLVLWFFWPSECWWTGMSSVWEGGVCGDPLSRPGFVTVLRKVLGVVQQPMGSIVDILLEATVGAPLWFLDVVLEVTLASFSADRMTALTDSELAAVHLLLTSVLRRCVELALPTSPSLIRSLLRLLSHASQSGDSRHRVWISREMLAGVLVAHACAAHVDGCQAVELPPPLAGKVSPFQSCACEGGKSAESGTKSTCPFERRRPSLYPVCAACSLCSAAESLLALLGAER